MYCEILKFQFTLIESFKIFSLLFTYPVKNQEFGSLPELFSECFTIVIIELFAT